jgi:hypothetical protein
MTSCLKSGFEGAEKTYTYDNMSLTMTENFREISYTGFDVCYESADVAVFCIKEPFTLAEGIEDLTLDDYAELTLEANAAQNPTLKDVDGIPVMEYTYYNEDTELTYAYFSALYKSGDAFWVVQFACNEELYAENEASLVKWAKSVTFS